jgi:hypothetical protein
MRRLAVALSMVTTLAFDVRGQTPAGASSALRVFVDCNFCDFDHLRVETPWVAFVRDRTVADVHLLLAEQSTGAGGERYTLHAIGLGSFASRGDTLSFSTAPDATDDIVRTEIVRNVQLALVPYALRTAAGRNLRVTSPESDDDDDRPSGPDRWNAWVFELSTGASMQREQQQSDVSGHGEIEAQRVTSALKIGFEIEAEFDRSRFTLDDGRKVTSTRESYNGGAVIVRSVGQRWGVGAELSVSSSTFENTRLAIRTAPAIEYSVWPYEEATRRQLTFQYSVGASAFRYREETIFDRMSETRPTQALVIGYDVRQPWGEAEASVEAANYLDDPSQHRLVGNGSISFRVARGLQLEFGGSAALIHDQLAIVKRDATPEEILLQRRALRTDYRYDAFLGLSYTFGSIFNSVVNPRFGTGPGEILR